MFFGTLLDLVLPMCTMTKQVEMSYEDMIGCYDIARPTLPSHHTRYSDTRYSDTRYSDTRYSDTRYQRYAVQRHGPHIAQATNSMPPPPRSPIIPIARLGVPLPDLP